MKLSDKTLTILRNYASINSNVLIQPGTALKTVNDSMSIFATTETDDVFPVKVGIYDLTEFLAIISLLDEGNIDFDFRENNVLITNGKAKTNYFYADPRVLKQYPQNDIQMPDPFVTFTISGATLGQLKQAATIFGHPNISFYSDGSVIFARVFDLQTPDGSDFVVDVATMEEPVEFNYIFEIGNFKYLVQSDSYNIALAAKGKGKIAKIKSLEPKIDYFVVASSASVLNE